MLCVLFALSGEYLWQTGELSYNWEMPNTPLPALPPPYLCSDPGSFAENTLLARLPEIARRVIAENSFPAAANQKLEALIAQIPDGTVPDFDNLLGPDVDLWQAYLRPYQGLRWRQLSFLVGESVFYRAILEASGYFQPGATYQADPFAYQKQLGLETSRIAAQRLAARLSAWRKADFPPLTALSEAVETNLWGNRADLSLWPAGAAGTLSNTQLHQAEDFLLVNHVPLLAQVLLALPGSSRRVDFLIDNAGYELVCDLALADLLLGRGWAEEVHFHLKAHPTFVSDAMAKDVNHTLDFLRAGADENSAGLGDRQAAALAQGKLCLEEEYFWNSPLAAWEMPGEVRSGLARAGLVISKGDANYRRLLGDRRWPETTPFDHILAYFPTCLAALRISKCQLIAGLRPGQAADLDQRDPTWRTNGRWGMVQLR